MKKAISCVSSSNAMSPMCRIFDRGSIVFVAKMFRDVMSIVSSLNGSAGLDVFGLEAMTFALKNVVDFLWSVPPRERSRFSKGPIRLPTLSSFSTKVRRQVVRLAVQKKVLQGL